MKNIKSHFKFLKAERSGILCIIALIFIVQGIYFYTNPTKASNVFSDAKLIAYQQYIDSLKLEKLNAKPKRYPFNPNFISDYKGFTLGMSTEEIDRLHEFRAKNKYVNSAKEFQEITEISDSLLNELQPYFKFPKWVTQKKKRQKTKALNTSVKKEKKNIIKTNINTATIEELRKVYGIGEKLSLRIIKYRKKLGGFIAKSQLQEVYGLKPEVVQSVWQRFYIEKPIINKIEINTCSVEDLLKVPYINYDLADEIINQRILRERFKNFEELAKIQNFPADKIEIIKLYLRIQ